MTSESYYLNVKYVLVITSQLPKLSQKKWRIHVYKVSIHNAKLVQKLLDSLKLLLWTFMALQLHQILPTCIFNETRGNGATNILLYTCFDISYANTPSSNFCKTHDVANKKCGTFRKICYSFSLWILLSARDSWCYFWKHHENADGAYFMPLKIIFLIPC